MREVVLNKEALLKNEAGHGSSLASSGAGNSGRTFRLLHSAPRGVK